MSAHRNIMASLHPLVSRFANEQKAAWFKYPAHFRNSGGSSRIIELVDHVKAGNDIEFGVIEGQLIGGCQCDCVDAALFPKHRGVTRKINPKDLSELKPLLEPLHRISGSTTN